MGKTAFIFPGQGAQYVGMGKDFYEESGECRNIFEQASGLLGFDMAKICFTEEEKLNTTEYTQAAMITVIAAMLVQVKKTKLKADVTAGLSLGEYGALLTAEVLSFSDIIKLVRKRGIIMQEAYPSGGAMSAVLGFNADAAERICQETKGIVTVANYNCPGQLVISGEKESVMKAGETMLSEGAKKVVSLNVSGPFHSELLKEAGEILYGELKDVEVNDPVIPYVSNVTAEYITSAEPIKELLSRQVASSVKWQQSVENMIGKGITTFVEIGPGKTLSSFVKKINKEVKVITINKINDLEMYT